MANSLDPYKGQIASFEYEVESLTKSHERKKPYMGARVKVMDNSLMAQTLNKFELGECDKKKLSSESGVDYYRKHIHRSQGNRLQKYIRDPSGKMAKMKGFIPLSEIEKPSLSGTESK